MVKLLLNVIGNIIQRLLVSTSSTSEITALNTAIGAGHEPVKLWPCLLRWVSRQAKSLII